MGKMKFGSCVGGLPSLFLHMQVRVYYRLPIKYKLFLRILYTFFFVNIFSSFQAFIVFIDLVALIDFIDFNYFIVFFISLILLISLI